MAELEEEAVQELHKIWGEPRTVSVYYLLTSAGLQRTPQPYGSRVLRAYCGAFATLAAVFSLCRRRHIRDLFKIYRALHAVSIVR